MSKFWDELTVFLMKDIFKNRLTDKKVLRGLCSLVLREVKKIRKDEFYSSTGVINIRNYLEYILEMKINFQESNCLQKYIKILLAQLNPELTSKHLDLVTDSMQYLTRREYIDNRAIVFIINLTQQYGFKI